MNNQIWPLADPPFCEEVRVSIKDSDPSDSPVLQLGPTEADAYVFFGYYIAVRYLKPLTKTFSGEERAEDNTQTGKDTLSDVQLQLYKSSMFKLLDEFLLRLDCLLSASTLNASWELRI